MLPITLDIKNLKKCYNSRKHKHLAVDDISFSIKRGEITGLLGPNGAGKTSIIKMICGLIEPDSGSLTINGSTLKENRKAYMSNISAVFEGNRNVFWRLTVIENIEFQLSLRKLKLSSRITEVNYYIDIFNLENKRNTQAGKLSRGMQQKLSIVIALLTAKNIILLDEPTLGLDTESSYEIRSILGKIAKESNLAIIITTHDMNVVQDVCDKVIVIVNGKIVVNDYIENLLDILNTKSYSIYLESSLNSKQYQMLNNIADVELKDRNNNKKKIKVNTNCSKTLYDIIDILKINNAIIKKIDSEDINFESVYRKMLPIKERVN